MVLQAQRWDSLEEHILMKYSSPKVIHELDPSSPNKVQWSLLGTHDENYCLSPMEQMKRYYAIVKFLKFDGGTLIITRLFSGNTHRYITGKASNMGLLSHGSKANYIYICVCVHLYTHLERKGCIKQT